MSETDKQIHLFLIGIKENPGTAPIFADWLEEREICPLAWEPLRSYLGKIVVKAGLLIPTQLSEENKYTYIYNLLFPFPPDLQWTTPGRLIPLITRGTNIRNVINSHTNVEPIYWSPIQIDKYGLVYVERSCGKVLLAKRQGILLVKVRIHD